MPVKTSRHHSVFDPHAFHLPVHVVGCGGMGSHIAMALVRMGIGWKVPLHLYDHDSYEPHNIANQAIDQHCIGEPKVIALEQQLRYIDNSLEIIPIQQKVGSGFDFEGVVFLCLDSMEERYDIVNDCLEGNRNVRCVIETRMDAETGISHCFNPNNKRHMDCWWMYWYPTGHTEKTPGCGGKLSIVSAVYGTSAYALKQFEMFSRKKSRTQIPHRIYTDFRYPNNTNAEYWSETWIA